MPGLHKCKPLGLRVSPATRERITELCDRLGPVTRTQVVERAVREMHEREFAARVSTGVVRCETCGKPYEMSTNGNPFTCPACEKEDR